MSDFSINFGQAEAFLDDVERINQQIKLALDELERNVESSLDSWKSEQVRTAYQVAKARWDQSAIEMSGFLDNARHTLTGVVETYSHAETTNRARFE
ncbi:WXG100 family type VII secretion target [Paractinoplanes hotanensis]|uniref:WXG100 family type VII secretion target n=1 Tax=Paractinoplanes hotanensis TaxID=2906497 RepID=A0ABT0YCW2_9ACTN|nr:WXG100 family type VII secretion target [Actinoplanes hotanensis]MCM4083585.1 WXG100 family type VII secretion target [Actinoplanes hotanensis]